MINMNKVELLSFCSRKAQAPCLWHTRSSEA